MSMYNYEGIPDYLFGRRPRTGLASGSDGIERGSDTSSSASEDEDFEEDDFEVDILTLSDFHSISILSSRTSFETHRLIRLAAHVWLRSHERHKSGRKRSSHVWTGHFLMVNLRTGSDARNFTPL